ncbi:hypothetical protein PROFUN_12769 [Planoprotostelium fungivorum]|uniref:Uncharacterized protein n=1 Tax=Planoprotostelium fungivorum TaxID=1890364 RepID=A0A2P6N5K3_9EUKA|nr:hypothetical protein PROFUN_12769 [Planoprotostelium fungivorum]
MAPSLNELWPCQTALIPMVYVTVHKNAAYDLQLLEDKLYLLLMQELDSRLIYNFSPEIVYKQRYEGTVHFTLLSGWRYMLLSSGTASVHPKGQTLKQEAGLYHSAIGAPGLYEPTKARRIGIFSILAPKFAQSPISTSTLTQKKYVNHSILSAREIPPSRRTMTPSERSVSDRIPSDEGQEVT